MSELFKELLEFIDKLARGVCIFLIGLMVIVITLQIFFRYVLNSPLVWTEELSRFLMVWMAFIGASSVLKYKEHVYVSYYQDKLPFKVKKFINIMIEALILAFLACVTFIGMDVIQKVTVNQTSPGLRIKMYWPQMGMVFGLITMILQLIGVIINEIKNGNADNGGQNPF